MNKTHLFLKARQNSNFDLTKKKSADVLPLVEVSQIVRKFFALFSFLIISTAIVFSQQSPDDNRQATLGIDQGVVSFNTPNFDLELLKSSQTVSSLRKTDAEKFDFTPHQLLAKRDKDGYYHLGDLNFRLKTSADEQWESFSTAAKRASVKSLTPEK